MINHFKKENVKVLLWLTGTVNCECKDTPMQKCESYDEVVKNNYGINNSQPHDWWKGKGIQIDFTNNVAKQWWYKQLDKVFTDGVYGWKVDQGEFYFGDSVDTSIGRLNNEQFRPYYYDAMFDYTVCKKPEGIIIVRPYSHQGGFAASIDKMNMGWCGDFSGDWEGLKFQIQNIYKSALRAYGAVGCEIGGFFKKRATKRQFIRYSQFGCMTACMINGGCNGAFTSHLPWYHGKEVEDIYRDCVLLHYKLVPYMFSTIVDVHLHGGSLMKNISYKEVSHQLGDFIFTKVIISDDGHVEFHLLLDGMWIDYWSNKPYYTGSLITEKYPLNHFPLFIKSRYVIPIDIDNHHAILIYPNGRTVRELHLPTGEGAEYKNCIIDYDQKSGKLYIDSQSDVALTVIVRNVPRVIRVETSSLWKYNNEKHEFSITNVPPQSDMTIITQ